MTYFKLIDISSRSETPRPINNLKSLNEELKRLRKDEGERIYREIYSFAINSGISRFADYIGKKGKIGMEIAKNATRWINDAEDRTFRDSLGLTWTFFRKKGDVEKVWYVGDSFIEGKEEFLGIIKKMISHPSTRKLMWGDPGIFKKVRPKLAYVYKNPGQKPIVIVINDKGYIENIVTDKTLHEVYHSVYYFYDIDTLEGEHYSLWY